MSVKYSTFAITTSNSVKPFIADGHKGWYKKEIRAIAKKYLRKTGLRTATIFFGKAFPLSANDSGEEVKI